MATKPKKDEKASKKGSNAQETQAVQIENAALSAATEILAKRMEMAYAVQSIASDFDVDPPAIELKIKAAMDKLKSQSDADKATQVAQEAEAKAKEASVTAMVAAAASRNLVVIDSPRAFKLRLSHTEVIDIKKGVQEVPVEIANHRYCKQNAVKVFQRA